MPPQPPSWVDDLADNVEIERLKSMGVMIEEDLFNGPPINSKLTTKHMHDWRLKPFEQGKKWLRRSRLVAREFAWEKRSDTFSPATSSHTMNVLPVVYLGRLAEEESFEGLPSGDPCTLGVVDIKDAFLMVDQQGTTTSCPPNRQLCPAQESTRAKIGRKELVLALS